MQIWRPYRQVRLELGEEGVTDEKSETLITGGLFQKFTIDSICFKKNEATIGDCGLLLLTYENEAY